jgi:magnesium-transporting ATPase (P-type)
MDGAWHRLGVSLDLREDPDSEARRKARQSSSARGRVGYLARSLIEIALLLVACVLFFSVLVLIVHLVFGGNTNPRGVLVAGLRSFGVALTIAMVVFFVGRWLYWFADRRMRQG